MAVLYSWTALQFLEARRALYGYMHSTTTTPRRGAAGYVPTLPQNVARTIRLHIRQIACHARSRLAYAYPRPPVRYVAGSLAEPSQQPLPDVDCPRYDSEGL